MSETGRKLKSETSTQENPASKIQFVRYRPEEEMFERLYTCKYLSELMDNPAPADSADYPDQSDS